MNKCIPSMPLAACDFSKEYYENQARSQDLINQSNFRPDFLAPLLQLMNRLEHEQGNPTVEHAAQVQKTDCKIEWDQTLNVTIAIRGDKDYISMDDNWDDFRNHPYTSYGYSVGGKPYTISRGWIDITFSFQLTTSSRALGSEWPLSEVSMKTYSDSFTTFEPISVSPCFWGASKLNIKSEELLS